MRWWAACNGLVDHRAATAVCAHSLGMRFPREVPRDPIFRGCHSDMRYGGCEQHTPSWPRVQTALRILALLLAHSICIRIATCLPVMLAGPLSGRHEWAHFQ